MNAEELELLLSPAVRGWIATHRAMSPYALAMQRHPQGFPARLAIAQIALLQKAEVKLPTWAMHACLLPARAYEQATSEALALAKPWATGTRALDLSCGLGSDDRAIAMQYDQVVALEPDDDLRAVVHANLALLGIHNVDLRADRAEDFLARYEGPPFDLVYIDPDRRDAKGNRQFALRDCQPDVLALLPRLRAIAQRILIKASPMLDLSAIAAELPCPTTLWVAAEANECKELLIEIDAQQPNPLARAALFLRKGLVHRFVGGAGALAPVWDAGQSPAFLFEADTALYKAGLSAEWFAQLGKMPNGGMVGQEGYYFAQEDQPDFHGHRFKVIAAMPFKPQEIKKYCKRNGISRIQYSRRDFDVPLTQVRAQVQVPEGGHFYLLLTRMGTAGRMAFVAERLD